jgi:hypothetical protein
MRDADLDYGFGPRGETLCGCCRGLNHQAAKGIRRNIPRMIKEFREQEEFRGKSFPKQQQTKNKAA